jgi:hypothetical protein
VIFLATCWGPGRHESGIELVQVSQDSLFLQGFSVKMIVHLPKFMPAYKDDERASLGDMAMEGYSSRSLPTNACPNSNEPNKDV